MKWQRSNSQHAYYFDTTIGSKSYAVRGGDVTVDGEKHDATGLICKEDQQLAYYYTPTEGFTGISESVLYDGEDNRLGHLVYKGDEYNPSWTYYPSGHPKGMVVDSRCWGKVLTFYRFQQEEINKMLASDEPKVVIFRESLSRSVLYVLRQIADEGGLA